MSLVFPFVGVPRRTAITTVMNEAVILDFMAVDKELIVHITAVGNSLELNHVLFRLEPFFDV